MKQVKPVVAQWVLIEYGTKRNRIGCDIPYSLEEINEQARGDYSGFKCKSRYRPVYAKSEGVSDEIRINTSKT